MNENAGKKLTADIVFEKTTCAVPREIKTQEIERLVDSWDEVLNCILDMFEDEDEFVVLTVGDELFHQIRYVQARQIPNGIIVQLGIEEGGQTRLVEKECTTEECLDIFQEFYDLALVENIDQYTPVQFWV